MNRDDLLRVLAAMVYVQHNGKLPMREAISVADSTLTEVDIVLAYRTGETVQ